MERGKRGGKRAGPIALFVMDGGEMRNIYRNHEVMFQWTMVNLVSFVIVYFLGRKIIFDLARSATGLFPIYDDVTRAVTSLLFYIIISSLFLGAIIATMQWAILRIRKFKIRKWFLVTFICYSLAYFTAYFLCCGELFSDGKLNFNIFPKLFVAQNIIFSTSIGGGDSSIVVIGLYSIVLGFLIGALFGLISGFGQWVVLRKSGFKKSSCFWLKSLIVSCGLGNSLCSFIVTMIPNVFLVKNRISTSYTLPLFFVLIGLSVGISTANPLKLMLSKQHRVKPLPQPAILNP
jgi:hypothetical protein